MDLVLESRNGFLLSITSRCSGIIAKSVLNYLLGFTSLSTRDFIIGTSIGMLPGIAG